MKNLSNIRTLNKENDTIEAKSKPTLASASQSKIGARYNVNKPSEEPVEGKDIDSKLSRL